MWPDQGLKKVSSLKMPAQPLPKSSRPCSPNLDWLRLLPTTVDTEPLLFFWINSSVPNGA